MSQFANLAPYKPTVPAGPPGEAQTQFEYEQSLGLHFRRYFIEEAFEAGLEREKSIAGGLGSLLGCTLLRRSVSAFGLGDYGLQFEGVGSHRRAAHCGGGI